MKICTAVLSTKSGRPERTNAPNTACTKRNSRAAQFDANVFGVGAASALFFDKVPLQITSREAALLMAVLPNPQQYKVERPSAYVQGRVSRIQTQMRQLGGDYLRDL